MPNYSSIDEFYTRGLEPITEVSRYGDTHCPICYEKLFSVDTEGMTSEQTNEKMTVVRIRNCDHTYHEHCLKRWLTEGKNTCPLDRTQLFSLPEDDPDDWENGEDEYVDDEYVQILLSLTIEGTFQVEDIPENLRHGAMAHLQALALAMSPPQGAQQGGVMDQGEPTLIQHQVDDEGVLRRLLGQDMDSLSTVQRLFRVLNARNRLDELRVFQVELLIRILTDSGIIYRNQNQAVREQIVANRISAFNQTQIIPVFEPMPTSREEWLEGEITVSMELARIFRDIAVLRREEERLQGEWQPEEDA